MPISRRRKVSHVISAVVEARDRYSTSVFDLETVGCFFEDQEIQLDPKYIQHPVVLLQVVLQPPQYASQKPFKVREL